MKPFFTSLAIVVVATAWASAADPVPSSGDKMIEKYLADETARLSQRVLDGATTRADWEKRRPRLKQEYFEMLGLWPLPEKTALHATVTGTLDGDGFVVEKLHFQSRPGLYVTGNLYRPRKVEGKLPAVLYVCGHANRGRNGNKAAYQDHGAWFATNGYVCLVLDTLQLGEVAGIHHGTYSQGRWWWQARGYTSAGVECWNGIRGIDYLVSRPEVDPERIAVTGISGGGAATLWISAADERVKCAVPVSGMSDLESYVTNKIINGHCDCMLMINTYQWEWTTIAALVAPRPMLFANSDADPIFPMDGNRRIIERLRKAYALYDKPEMIDDYVSKGGHAYRPDLRVAVFKWLNKHVKNDLGPVKDSAELKLFPEEKLRVFPEDKDLPKDSLNDKIDETFVPMAKPTLPEEGKFDEWKKGLMTELRAKSFRAFPESIKGPIKINPHKGAPLVELTTEPGIIASLISHVPTDALATLVLQSEAEPKWTKPYQQHDYGFLHDDRWTSWTRKSPPNYVERSHALIGRTVQEGTVYDLVCTIQWLKESKAKGKQNYRVIGKGQSGILAAYAALFEPAITEVVIVDPPASHRDGPILLNVLRVCDVPEALGMLAPRPLTLVNATDKAFDRTAEIYRRAGADKKFVRK